MERNEEYLRIFVIKYIKKQFPNAEVKRIRVTQGDGGIAVYVECSNIRIGPGFKIHSPIRKITNNV